MLDGATSVCRLKDTTNTYKHATQPNYLQDFFSAMALEEAEDFKCVFVVSRVLESK